MGGGRGRGWAVWDGNSAQKDWTGTARTQGGRPEDDRHCASIGAKMNTLHEDIGVLIVFWSDRSGKVRADTGFHSFLWAVRRNVTSCFRDLSQLFLREFTISRRRREVQQLIVNSEAERPRQDLASVSVQSTSLILLSDPPLL
jgi:hypothetical protein